MYKSKLYTLIFFLSLTGLCSNGFANDSFILNSIIEAKALAKEINQPLLLIFGSKSCRFCESLKNDLENNKLPVEPFILCYIDTELEMNDKYITEYKISSIPDSRILNHNSIISTFKGYGKADYTKWLKSYNEKIK